MKEMNTPFRKGVCLVYKNPDYKKVKNSFILLVSCGYCKTDIAEYQKVGKGNLLRMYTDRIIKGSIDWSKKPKSLYCPNCGKLLATRIMLKKKNKEAYKMIRSTYNTRRVN
ncbi:MAG: hypothetical protein GX024_11160 [Clostridiales bacterium]|nr:hypothetical protein [Clostridiales bacterium]